MKTYRRLKCLNLTKTKVIIFTVCLLCVFSMYLSIYYTWTAPSFQPDEILKTFWRTLPIEPNRFNRTTQLTTSARRSSDFRLLYPIVEPSLSNQELYIAVVVNSASTSEKHRELRMAIRKTWGDSTIQDNSNNNTWKVFFVLGISDNTSFHKINIKEALQHNDVIMGNLKEYYKNIALKTFMAHYWVVSKLPSCKYVLKTDDDVYVRVPQLITWLKKKGSPGSFYGGFVSRHLKPIRDPTSKWFITEEQFNETKWPPFCHGAFHVLSTDILPKYFNYSLYRRKPFHTDDAYLGVVARDLNISAVEIPGFNLEFQGYKTRSDCDQMTSIAMGHMLNVYNMFEYYSYYKKNTTKKFDFKKCI